MRISVPFGRQNEGWLGNPWRSLSVKQKRNLGGWIFISPWLVGFFSLLLIPLIQSIIFSFSSINVTTGGYFLERVGWENYEYILFGHPEYVRLVTESIGNMVANVPLILIFSIFAASLIQGRFPGRTVSRMVFFLPVIIGSGVVLRLQAQDWMKEIMQTSIDMGEGSIGLQSFALEQYLLESGLHEDFVLYITGAVNRIHEIISRSGVQILLALAGLQSIPDSFYEAAEMEGATKWEIFWKITFPILTPILLASAVYTIVDSFTAVDNKTMELVRSTAFGQSNYGQSAAMAWIYFVIIAIIVALLFTISSRKVFYQE